jgi:hypothetical protein
MLLTPHTIVGIAVATAIPNPYIAVPTSFILHFLGDLVPHWDYCHKSHEGVIDKKYPLKIMADLSLGIGFGLFFTLYFLWQMKNPGMAINTFLCGIAAVLPDAITGPIIFDGDTKGFPKLMYKIQDKIHSVAPLPWGLISQLVVAGACLLLILNSTVLS